LSGKGEKMYPKNLFYTDEHEWLDAEGSEGNVGITDFAAKQLGDIVYVELPEKGDTYSKGETFGTIESVKAVSDLYMPVDGEIIDINVELEESPELVNSSPYEDGWMVKISIKNEEQIQELMDSDEYNAYVEEQKE
jgi:glycine cleavage system H protein